MMDRWPGAQQKGGPDHCLAAMLGDEGAYLGSERRGHLLHLSLGQLGHAAEIDLITPKEVCNSGREIVRWCNLRLDHGNSILPLAVAFPQPLRACESANLLPSLS
jgi:hypothetical protein